jgi:uncharacterized protein with ATP-grasp and redox domains
MGATIHQIIREETGDRDPYLAVKVESNRVALAFLPELRAQVERSDNPFETAARLAIAGNIIDFAIMHSVDKALIESTIRDALRLPLATDHVDELREAVEAASSILYLCDNAGEIALDRLFLEQMPPGRVTCVVRGSPVINDATVEDASIAGVFEVADVIDNGSSVPGTLLEDCSDEFRDRFWQADVVISKGQGNYETLSEIEREVFHLLKVKCPMAARDLDCDVGSIVTVRTGHGMQPAI